MSQADALTKKEIDISRENFFQICYFISLSEAVEQLLSLLENVNIKQSSLAQKTIITFAN